ncbi:hypothetical protein EDC96DRAFT_128390 [Choanephora cucurbitarum]|nr:hypothetical protein EDC96DRAFT_128390 [Choanephora cucurbitarum]
MKRNYLKVNHKLQRFSLITSVRNQMLIAFSLDVIFFYHSIEMMIFKERFYELFFLILMENTLELVECIVSSLILGKKKRYS